MEFRLIDSKRTDKQIVHRINQAAKLMKKRNQLLGQLHRNILGPDWTFDRVVTLPMVDSLPDLSDLCGHCRPYVLDRSGLEDKLTLFLAGQPASHHVDHQYKNLVTRDQFNTLTNPPSPLVQKWFFFVTYRTFLLGKILLTWAISGTFNPNP